VPLVGSRGMTTHQLKRSLSITTAVGGLVACLLAALVLAAPRALAAEVVVADPAHDTDRSGLDLLSATIDNTDYALSVHVGYTRHRSGNTIVGVDARGRETLRVVNSHHAHGRDRTMLLDSDRRIACDGLASRWRPRAAELTLVVPSACLWDGDYGALRTWVLTEPLHSGADVDQLVQHAWVARG
jgi:hypothetical protein